MTGTLTVLSVGYALAPVRPDGAGGAEQVLAMIDRALAAGGHRSIVVAPMASRIAGTLLSTPAVPDRIDACARAGAVAATRARVAEAVQCFDIDLVHMHGLDFAATMPRHGPPVLVTLHLPPDWYPDGALARGGARLHCVSASQHRACPPGVRLLPPIANGVALGPEPKRGGVRDGAVMLARICPEKGAHDALRAAHLAGCGLTIAGHVFGYDAHRAYWTDCIAPLLDARRRFVGGVAGTGKRRLLEGARCVLVPSTAPETSSLVAMEALAAGTPVIAYPSGALAEIVEDGVTGFLVMSPEAMARRIGDVGHIDPDACRRVAVTRFDARRMTDAYLHRYREMASVPT